MVRIWQIFCYVLRIIWCHQTCFSCYLRQNGGAINVSKFEVLTSPLFPYFRFCSVGPSANSPNLTHRFAQDSHNFKTLNFVQIRFTLHCFAFLHLSLPFIISPCQMASLQSRTDAAADTPA